MSSADQPPLRVELTILDNKLNREDIQFHPQPIPHLLYATRYEEAVSPPFPADGKNGLSLFVGRLEQYRQVEVPLLWELERKRGRLRMAVVTNLRTKSIVPTMREIGSALGDPLVTPISVLRRRGKVWDGLDFFSSGSSPSMEGAAQRLKRLKQRGWEAVVDNVSITDPVIKELYFEELHVERELLKQAFVDGLAQGRLSAMVGIAGQCLQKENLAEFLHEEMNARILVAAHRSFSENSNSERWVYLSKRSSGSELVLLAKGEQWLEAGQVLSGEDPRSTRPSEFLIAKLLQRVQTGPPGAIHTCVRVKVQWRYRPDREIPVIWKQNSTSAAGSTAPNG